MSTLKNITNIPGKIRINLPDGTVKEFANALLAQEFFNKNYGDNYSLQINSAEDNDGNVSVNGGEKKELEVIYNSDNTNSEYNDPVRSEIFNGKYNGRSFSPTPQNIQYYLNLYDSDKKINKEYSDTQWAKLFGGHALAGIGIAGAATAPMWAPAVGSWIANTGTPLLMQHIIAPTAAGMLWDEGQKALTGTTTTEQISNYLQNKGWNPIVADAVGSTSNPGYWINFGGVGKYTKPFFNKIGIGLLPFLGNIELSPTMLANINALIPKSKFLTNVVEPVNSYIDKNLPNAVRYWTNPNYRLKVINARKFKDGISSDKFLDPIRIERDNKLKIIGNKTKLVEDQLASTNRTLDQMQYKFNSLFYRKYDPTTRMLKYWDGPTTFTSFTHFEKPDYITYTDELGNIFNSDITSVSPSTKKISFNIPKGRYNHFDNTPLISYSENGSYESYFLQLPEELISAISQRNNRLRSIIGDDGVIGGSGSVMENGTIAGSPDDDDIITTVTRLPSLMQKLNARKIVDLPGNTGIRIESNNLKLNKDNLHIGDVDIIYELNGHAIGKLAHELYEIFYPTEYKQIRESFRNNTAYQEYLNGGYYDINSISNTELPVSSELLYSLVKLNPEVKSLMDLLFSHKEKHNKRAFTAIILPKNTELVKRMIDAKSTSLYGESIKLPQGFDLSNIEANKELLNRYGLPVELASNKEVMENISRYLYLSLGSITRGVKIRHLKNNNGEYIDQYKLPVDEFANILSGAHNITYSLQAGSASGIGGNFTLGSRGGGTFGDDLSIGLLNIPEEINNPIKLYNYLSQEESKITKELANLINTFMRDNNLKLYGIRDQLKEGDQYRYVLSAISDADSKENNQKISEILQVPFLKGDPYYNSFDNMPGKIIPNYVGVISDNAFKSRGFTYSKPTDLNLEHGSFKPFYNSGMLITGNTRISIDDTINMISSFSNFEGKDRLISFLNKVKTQVDSDAKLTLNYSNKIGYLTKVRNILLSKHTNLNTEYNFTLNSYNNKINKIYAKLKNANDSYYHHYTQEREIARDIQQKAKKLANISVGTIIAAALAVPAGMKINSSIEEDKKIEQWYREHNYSLDTDFGELSKEDLESFLKLFD